MNNPLAVGALIALAPSLQGAVLYDNGAPIEGDVIPYLGAEKGDDFLCESADDFVLPAGTGPIRQINWWGDYFFVGNDTPKADDFTLVVYDSAPGEHAPGQVRTPVQVVSLTRTWVDLGAIDAFLYTATVRELSLAPGTPYWLGIANESGQAGLWGWRASELEGSAYSRNAATKEFEQEGANAAFFMTDGTVPAPGAIALAAFAGVIAMRRQR